MFAKRLKKSEIEVLPQHRAGVGLARCLTFYEWENPFGPEWLDAVESIFSMFGVEPSDVVGNFGGKRTSGNYGRARKRLFERLASQEDAALADVRIDSAPIHPDLDFFPSNIRITWTIGVSGIRMGLIAVRDSLVASCSELVEKIEQTVFEHTGPVYAAAFDFPAAYGPDYYLSAVGAVPSGVPTAANKPYRERITRWRDNTWHREFRMSQGYLREVYPINFVLDHHLEVIVNGSPMLEIMAEQGQVSAIAHTPGVHKWNVAPNNLMEARRILEDSGIILSSATCSELPFSASSA